MDEQNKKFKITNDFTLFRIALVVADGRQYPVNAEYLKTYLQHDSTIESIPWRELLGRRITSVWMDDGYLVLSLSTKDV